MRSMLLALLAATALVTTAQAKDVTVAVTAIVEHPALDAARDGVKDALAAAGFKEGENLKFVYQSAQGNPATAAQIARQFVGEAPDVIVPISTPSAQAVVSATRDIPIVFTAVSDPVGAQLVKDMAKPGGNVTGLSDMSPVAEHIKLIKEVMPNIKKLGYLYNSGETNSVSLLAALKEALLLKASRSLNRLQPNRRKFRAQPARFVGRAAMICADRTTPSFQRLKAPSVLPKKASCRSSPRIRIPSSVVRLPLSASTITTLASKPALSL